ncbi:phosphonate ABC transporter, permease protein PhnE [Prosthecodimorpha staleyi]|uniref:Phosphonate ABC transporter, permease protein PhnE n=1 Tax=Prosthecodimorpha staleyi TaxID=2840188 RepID=A0A947D2I0_9HYPH|nr:phosphonate ABC transporter, permease protein PhnE [Prosthecodimorpha staleyi]MBT9289770.1 phosphonate ABC transporter, permease protein PhnE [Prosthecodimorpha staleyi]
MRADTLPRLDPAVRDRLERGYQEATAARRRRTLTGFGLLVAAILLAGWLADVQPAKLFANFGSFTKYIHDILPVLRLDTADTGVAEWYWGWKRWLRQLGETLLIAYVGTLVGALGAFLLSFAAAGNLVRSPALRFAARRYLEFCRTVPEIVFALIFVVAFGLGPVPGVLAIAIHTMGALGKLFSEVVENIDMKPVEGLVSTGAGFVETVRFAVLPQILTNYASYMLLRFEVNVRGAAIMGYVGAGGIGQDLVEAIRKFYYTDVSAILLMIIITVVAIDMLTETLRHRVLGAEGGR